MNQVYKSLWNESTGSYVAVPETAKAAGQKVSSGRAAKRALGRVQTQRLVLEPRIVFDGALPVAVADMMDASSQFVDLDVEDSSFEAEVDENSTENSKNVESSTVDSVKTTSDNEQDAAATQERVVIEGTLALTNLTSNEIIFIDAHVGDLETYITDHPNADVVLIDSSKDGLSQIAAVLAGRTDIDSIHILSHGAAGQLSLGNTVVDLQSITGEHADELAVINAALSADADILIYGCDVAVGATGQEFVNALASATGADIAASIDTTGSADLGGDWDLEVQTAVVNTESLALTDWRGELANHAPVVDLNSGQVLQEQIVNGGFPDGTGWTASAGGWQFPGAAAYIDADTGTHTLTTNNNITGLDNGAALSGSAQLGFDLWWHDGTPASSSPSSTLNVYVGGVLYAKILTPVGDGTSATVVYSNGAIGSLATIPEGGLAPITFTNILIDLPSTVVASGKIIFEFIGGGAGADDFRIDNVSVKSYVDTTAGKDFSTTYTENGAPVSISDTDNSVNDTDDTNMESAVITLTNPQTGDRLLVNGLLTPSGTVNGISYTLSGNTVTLTGTATKANYAAAIRAIQFDSTSENPSTTPRTISVIVNDGTVNSNTAISTINVVPVNDAPVDGNETNTVIEDTTLTVADGASGDLLNNATDVDGGALTISAFTVAGQAGPFVVGTGYVIAGVGTITINANGSYNFAPVANFTGPIPLITYTVNDGAGGTDNSTLTLSMSAVNDPPVANPDTGAVNEDATLTRTALTGVIQGTGTDTDPDNTSTSLVVSGAVAGAGPVTQGSGVATSLTGTYGHLTLNADGSYTYIADTANGLAAGATANDVFTYTVKDPAGLVSNTTALTITVTGTNDAPVAVDDTATTTEDNP
ncbi:MAG: DUF4347 domain-containing protein, partial [Pseudomonadota bacterium]